MTTADQERRMQEAWALAADDLSIRAVVPFVIEGSGSGAAYVVWLKDFGGPGGAVAIPMGHENRTMLQETAKANGLWCSQLGPGYCDYRLDLFVETLDDWGWFGPDGERPIWYRTAP